MEQSKVTLLQGVNKVLENTGERRVNTFSSPVSRKCVEALTDAVLDIAALNDWEWTKNTVLAESWFNEVADLGDIQRLHGVSVGGALYGYWDVPFEHTQSFDRRPIQAYYSDGDRPRSYTIQTYNRIRFNPYPITAEQQASFRFYVTKSLIPPSLPNDVFPVPDRFMPLVYHKACELMAINHLDDAQAAASYARQFESLAARLRDRERNVPSGGYSIFRYRR